MGSQISGISTSADATVTVTNEEVVESLCFVSKKLFCFLFYVYSAMCSSSCGKLVIGCIKGFAFFDGEKKLASSATRGRA